MKLYQLTVERPQEEEEVEELTVPSVDNFEQLNKGKIIQWQGFHILHASFNHFAEIVSENV